MTKDERDTALVDRHTLKLNKRMSKYRPQKFNGTVWVRPQTSQDQLNAAVKQIKNYESDKCNNEK